MVECGSRRNTRHTPGVNDLASQTRHPLLLLCSLLIICTLDPHACAIMISGSRFGSHVRQPQPAQPVEEVHHADSEDRPRHPTVHTLTHVTAAEGEREFHRGAFNGRSHEFGVLNAGLAVHKHTIIVLRCGREASHLDGPDSVRRARCGVCVSCRQSVLCGDDLGGWVVMENLEAVGANVPEAGGFERFVTVHKMREKDHEVKRSDNQSYDEDRGHESCLPRTQHRFAGLGLVDRIEKPSRVKSTNAREAAKKSHISRECCVPGRRSRHCSKPKCYDSEKDCENRGEPSCNTDPPLAFGYVGGAHSSVDVVAESIMFFLVFFFVCFV